MTEPVRVAIVGGGCAAMAAAFELTKPAHEGRYEVTVYQMGWRQGGKGASGRGVAGRIEEHGLHLWMGYYENAFRLMRECYFELARDPSKVPMARWSDAFSPANFNAVTDWSPSERWRPWIVDFPPSPGLPGDADPRRWGVQDYLTRAAALLRTLLATIRLAGGEPETAPGEEVFPSLKVESLTEGALSAILGRLARFGALAGLGASIEAARALELVLSASPAVPQSLLSGFFDGVDALLRKQLAALTRNDDGVRRLWEVIDLLLAVIRGSIRFRLALHPRGFDAIDDYDSREWLRLNGASEDSINSAFVRSLYDLAFAYDRGDPRRPSIAAGSALRGALRAFFTYRGAFFWKMNAGMGDVVFAPLYEVLDRRGARFEFFHKLTNVRLAAGSPEAPHVEALEFDIQARARGPAYRPLVDVGGLPSWPSEPDYDQLVDGKRIKDEGWDLESQWDTRRAAARTLRVGQDFDLVVLGTGLGVVPYVCGEILERDSRWRDMIEHVRCVPTQAFQLWMKRDMRDLGWSEGPANVSGFVEPFDTWADMTHVAPRESWHESPRSIAYFCNVLPESADDPSPRAWHESTGKERAALSAAAGTFVRGQQDTVRENAIAFLNRDVHHLWPAAHSRLGEFRWDVLHAERKPRGPAGPRSFNAQYWTANVRPSDRYSQALPGSTRFRISPLDRTYDNLTIAGDWTSCGLNMGCVEAAVMSGLLAAHAIAGSPRLSDIVGYDHP